MLFCITSTNNDQKMLARARKPKIPWDKFKESAFREGHMFSQEKRKEEKKVMVCICFETR